ncbi:MAG TPA: phosphopantetheine-binding protein, partial [Myxococcales bacterium]|nr:phosphopantetheine-binding protein [Myxococcales bacterium]
EATRRLVTQVAAGRVVVSTCGLDARRHRGAGSGPRAEEGRTARPRHARPSLPTPYVEPGTELERNIALVYQQVLGFEPIGLDDNFFDLGGSSLIAVHASAQLRQALQADVPVATLYQRPTVRSLSELLAQDGDEVARQRAEKLVRRREELGRRNQWLHRRRRS